MPPLFLANSLQNGHEEGKQVASEAKQPEGSVQRKPFLFFKIIVRCRPRTVVVTMMEAKEAVR